MSSGSDVLECQALRQVRDEMGLINVKVMIPFCRTVQECRRALDEMARHWLRRVERGIEVYLMFEISSNVILAEEFAELCDGFSISSKDQTQLTLGVDRDSDIVAALFDERNPAVMRFISKTIRAAKVKGRKIGICGRRPATIRNSSLPGGARHRQHFAQPRCRDEHHQSGCDDRTEPWKMTAARGG